MEKIKTRRPLSLGTHLLVGCDIKCLEWTKNWQFHLIVNDSDVMYLTKLVRGHEDIHVYVEHPIYDPILVDE